MLRVESSPGLSAGSGGMVLASIVLVSGLLPIVVPQASVAVVAAWLLLTLLGVFAIMRLRARSLDIPVSATSALALYHILVTLIVPSSWLFGLSEPWAELANHLNLIVTSTFLFSTVFLAGLGAAQSTRLAFRSPRSEQWLTAKQAHSVLVVGIAGCLLGLLVLSSAAGGLAALSSSLFFAREVFAGLGWIYTLLSIPAFAVALALQSKRFSFVTLLLIGLNAGIYFAGVFLTGAKIRAVFFVIIVAIAASARWPIKWRYLVAATVIFIPVSVVYHYEVRQGWSLGHSEATIDTRSPLEALRSTWGPFVSDGVDVIRTIGVVAATNSSGSGPIEVALAAPATVVPSIVWPDKPTGSSVEFSREFYPEKWIRGTGIPPSWAAESLWIWGWGLGLLVYFTTAYAIGIVDRRFRRLSQLTTRVTASAWLAVASLMLIKSGSGSAFRTSANYGFAALIALIVLHLQRKRERASKQESSRMDSNVSQYHYR